MNYSEQAITFSCAEEELLGILALPEQPEATGVLVLVGGPQYRVGSHRQFLLLSRALAGIGYPTMRFDYRGMGDSTGDQRSFENANEDISKAADTFYANCPQLDHIVLWGLCDAASASLLYWDTKLDTRISGLVLVNPWVRSETTLARTQIKHYYGQRLLQLEFWGKLLTGKVGLNRAIWGFLDSVRNACKANAENTKDQHALFQKRMARGLGAFSGPALLILSGNDYTAKEFMEHCKGDSDWLNVLKDQKITMAEVGEADHTFSSEQWRGGVEILTIEWLKRCGVR